MRLWCACGVAVSEVVVKAEERALVEMQWSEEAQSNAAACDPETPAAS